MMGQKPDEDIRRPMQWSADNQAGFTSGTPWREPDININLVNVEIETEDKDSLLNHYRTLIHFRMEHPALRIGRSQLVKTINAKLYANLRMSQDENLLVVINTSSAEIVKYRFAADETGLLPGDYRLISIYGPEFEASLEIDENGSFNLEPEFLIPPYTTLILEITSD